MYTAHTPSICKLPEVLPERLLRKESHGWHGFISLSINNTKITNLQFNAQEISRFEHGTLNVAALEV